jgi:hypothetical protein
VKLRALYIAIKDGEATWAQAVENKKGEAAKVEPKAPVEPKTEATEGTASASAAVEGTVVAATGDGHPPAARKRRPAASME